MRERPRLDQRANGVEQRAHLRQSLRAVATIDISCDASWARAARPSPFSATTDFGGCDLLGRHSEEATSWTPSMRSRASVDGGVVSARSVAAAGVLPAGSVVSRRGEGTGIRRTSRARIGLTIPV